MGVTVRSATNDDAVALSRLAESAIRETYAPIAGPAVYESVIAQTCTAAAFEAAIARSVEPGTWLLVAEEAGSLVGFLDFGPEGAGFELRRLYCAVGLTGRGVGVTLLRELDRRLGEHAEYDVIVHANNERGLKFWLREGFVPVAEIGFQQHASGHRGLAFDRSEADRPEPCLVLRRRT